MEKGRPLTLKRQRAISAPRSRSFDHQAQVVIDVDPFHLVEPFTYGIPTEFLSSVGVGSVVRVPFRSEIVDGYVVEIREEISVSAKPIVEVPDLVRIPGDLLIAARELSARYATRLVDILKMVPRVPYAAQNLPDERRGQIRFVNSPEDPYRAALSSLSKSGRSLLIVATERELDYIEILAKSYLSKTMIRIRTHGSERSRRLALAEVAKHDNCLILGARNSILLPIPIREVAVVGDQSPHFWEQRAPYWNLRDVALTRAQQGAFDLGFYSEAPSLELYRLIEDGYVKSQGLRSQKKEHVYAFAPDSFHSVIRAGLKNGVVLITVADKTYSNFFSCQRCRALPICSCGGRITMIDDRHITCSLCGETKGEWHCAECGGSTRRLLRRGATRISAELGKAFPNTPIRVVTGDAPLDSEFTSGIVVATRGAEPLHLPVTALVLLDGEALIARSGLRGEELVRNHWGRLISLLPSQASIYISLMRNHRISQALVSKNFSPALRSEMAERVELDLPPKMRVVVVGGSERDLFGLAFELRKDFPNLICSSVIKRKENSTLVVRFDRASARELSNALFTLQRYRSSTRRDLFSLRFDPLII